MINSSTFNFLSDLASNNNRDWFLLNKDRFENARLNVLNFASDVLAGISKFDPSIPSTLVSKDCVNRIYRDIRFSKDKTPYKSNFGIGFSPNGKKFNGPGYYLHIHPEDSFIGGGCWMPEAGLLKAIRQEIDYNGTDFRNIIEKSSFLNYFGGLDTEYNLKTCPKGYEIDHPELEFLKLKSFTFTHALNQKELSSPNAAEQVIEGFAKLYPFIGFLRNAIS
jgi:uncharacterized protein (TIGR02453 family)